MGSSRNALNRNIVVGRLDHQFRSSDLVTARYYINDYKLDDDGAYKIPVSDPTATTTEGRVQSIMISQVHTFSPTLLNSCPVEVHMSVTANFKVEP